MDSVEYRLYSFIILAAVQMSQLHLISSLGIQPIEVFGHSSGEFLCAYSSGLTDFNSTCALIYSFGRSMQCHQEIVGRMAVAAISPKAATELLNDYQESTKDNTIVISCYNSDKSTTFSGSIASIDSLIRFAATKQLKLMAIPSCFNPFHSPSFAPVMDTFLDYMDFYETLEKEILPPPEQFCLPLNAQWISSAHVDENNCGVVFTSFDQFYSIYPSISRYFYQSMLAPVKFFAVSLSDYRLSPLDEQISIEISPNAIFQKIHNENWPQIDYFRLARKGYGIRPMLELLAKLIQFPRSCFNTLESIEALESIFRACNSNSQSIQPTNSIKI